MSTLSKTAAIREGTPSSVEPFVYPFIPAPAGSETWESPFAGNSGGSLSLVQRSPNAAGKGNDSENEKATLARKAHEEGFREGQAQARVEFAQALASERAGLAVEIVNFRKDRDAYFQQVEAEVVRLALKIARRILHRETQMDPLLLRGAVRVVLDTMAQGTTVKLRLNPAQVSGWREYLAGLSDNEPLELVGDGSLEPGQCLVETALGVADFSPETQLQEIERGFFDLMTPPLGTT